MAHSKGKGQLQAMLAEPSEAAAGGSEQGGFVVALIENRAKEASSAGLPTVAGL